VLILSLIGCFAGTLLTKPEDDEVLKDFYRRVRPWGFWGPIYRKVLAEDPGFKRNTDFMRDMFNVAVGIVWQIALVVLPMYVVIWELKRAAITLAIVLGTSAILKFTWYDHLERREVETDKAAASRVPLLNPPRFFGRVENGQKDQIAETRAKAGTAREPAHSGRVS
jgi:solute:Na+ symporter, SSS family